MLFSGPPQLALTFPEFAQKFTDLVWSEYLAYTLGSIGLIFTFLTLGIQWRALTHGFDVVRGKFDNPEDEGNISHFQALCTALSATIGLGNISGVAIAIAAGGPGAVFYMWIVGFLGMATKFMTCSLATMFREQDKDGTYRGGPMYYIEIGLGKSWKPLAILFAVLGALASLGAGNMYQANQVADIVTGLVQELNATGLSDGEEKTVALTVGGILFVLAGLVIIGGIQRIGNVASKVVPTMVVIYCAGALYVILVNITEVPAMLGAILSEAWSGSAAEGAFYGIIVREVFVLGVKRACFSNEAGLGSAPIAHATAKTNEPIREGVVAAMGPFIDTIVVCTMTALVILITQSHTRTEVGTVAQVERNDNAVTVEIQPNPDHAFDIGENLVLLPTPETRDKWRKSDPGFKPILKGEVTNLGASERPRAVFELKVPEGRKLEDLDALLEPRSPIYEEREGIGLTAYAFDRVIPNFGTYFLPIAAFFFAFSTIVSWSFYGETCTRYLFGHRAVLPFKLLYVCGILVGVSFSLKPVLNFSDAMLGLMLIPNLIGTFLLAPRVMRATRDYFGRLSSGAFDEEVRRAAEAKKRK